MYMYMYYTRTRTHMFMYICIYIYIICMLRILSLSRPRVLGSDCVSSERPVIPLARTYDLCRARVKHALSVCFQVFAVLIFGVSAMTSCLVMPQNHPANLSEPIKDLGFRA